jgi:hypothetical protein
MTAGAPSRSHRSRSVGARLVAVPDRLAELAHGQYGVLSRDQLRAAGFGKDHVRTAVQARRWQAFGRRVVVLHNATLSSRQREWVAVLLAGKPAALAGLTAAAAAGLTGFSSDRVHVLVARDSNAGWPSWVQVHNSNRFAPRDVQANASPPRTRIARAVVDAASWSANPRCACAIVCAAVQQRLTATDRLAVELRHAGAVRHAGVLRTLLGDIAGGGHTLAEIELTALAHRAGLPPPRRQVLRREPGGRARYLDAEFDLPDGTVLAVEIDGSVHLEPLTWWDDMVRQNELTISRCVTLRFGSMAIRLAPELVVDQLRRIRQAHE